MSGKSNDEEFLTVADVAALLKLNQQTVRNWIDQGSLPAVRIGRRVRVRRQDLDTILNASQTGSAPTAAPPEPAGPSGDDFWGGATVGAADVASDAG